MHPARSCTTFSKKIFLSESVNKKIPNYITKTTKNIFNQNKGKDDRRDSAEPTSLESSSSPFSSLTVTLGSPTSTGSGASTSASERDQNLAICAVLLDEWLKELSAIAQEHYIVMLPDGASADS